MHTHAILTAPPALAREDLRRVAPAASLDEPAEPLADARLGMAFRAAAESGIMGAT